MSQDNSVIFEGGDEYRVEDYACFGILSSCDLCLNHRRVRLGLPKDTPVIEFGFQPPFSGSFISNIREVVEAAREMAGITDPELARYDEDSGQVRVSANIPADQAMSFAFMVRNHHNQISRARAVIVQALAESELTLKEQILLTNIGHFSVPFNQQEVENVNFTLYRGLNEGIIISAHFLSKEQVANILSDRDVRGFSQESFAEQGGYHRERHDHHDPVYSIAEYDVSVTWGAISLEEFIDDDCDGATTGMVSSSMYDPSLGNTRMFAESGEFKIDELVAMFRSLD